MSKKDIVNKASDALEQIFNDQGGIQRKELEIIKKRADELYYATASSSNRQYLQLNHLVAGYLYLLETGCTADEAFQFIMDTFDKTQQFIDDNKNRYNFHLKNTVKEADSHPKQRKMLRKGIMDKNVLSTANTPNQQYRRLSRAVRLHDSLEEAEGRNKKLVSDLMQEKGEVAVAHKKLSDNQIKDILESEDFDVMPSKEKAKILQSVGWTQQQIAVRLEKSERTVRRWLKE